MSNEKSSPFGVIVVILLIALALGYVWVSADPDLPPAEAPKTEVKPSQLR